jgi:hypothetical protein
VAAGHVGHTAGSSIEYQADLAQLRLAQAAQFAFIGDAIAVAVLLDAQLAKGRIAGVKPPMLNAVLAIEAIAPIETRTEPPAIAPVTTAIPTGIPNQ